MTSRPEEWPPCVDCDEPGARSTSPGGRCRECDIEHIVGTGSCRECGVFVMREEIAGPRAAQHKPGCSLADSDDYGPMPSRDDVWKAAYGTLVDLADDYDREAERLAADDPRADVGRTIVADLRRRAAFYLPRIVERRRAAGCES